MNTNGNKNGNSGLCIFGNEPLTIEDVILLAKRKTLPQLTDDPAFKDRIQKGANFLDRLLKEDGYIYGVTTGYGDSCTVDIPDSLVQQLPHKLYTYHGCGLGRFLDAEETRAVLVARLASLVRGMSGVSPYTLEVSFRAISLQYSYITISTNYYIIFLYLFSIFTKILGELCPAGKTSVYPPA